MENQTSETIQAAEPVVDQEKLKFYMEKLKLEQNLMMGLGAGIVAATVGAFLWAVITLITGHQIGYMAIGVGFIVGYSICYFGKGIDQIFGISGAILALLGCLCGNFLSIVGSISNAEDLPYMEVLGVMNLTIIEAMMTATFSPIDLLFYGFAIYEGYKFSFRKLTEEEIKANAI